tara:strand:- start:24288 stop:24968 length:681 start_codon:yes stop_codon:yes gene_type:complete
MEKYKKHNLSVFIIFTLLAFGLHALQAFEFFKYSFKPVEVFFHESSHLVTSLLFGGKIEAFHLEWQSGFVSHYISKGIPSIITSFNGYLGASLFGFLMYYSSLHVSKFLKIFLMIYCSFFFLYSDGLMTSFILAGIIGLWFALWKLGTFGCYVLRFIGVYVMVSSIYSPTYLWAYTDSGDHVNLSEATFLPSFVFILSWIAIGLFFLFLAFKTTNKENDKLNGSLK